jgi:hypothetical protein
MTGTQEVTVEFVTRSPTGRGCTPNMSFITPQQLYAWCKIPCQELATHPQRKIPFRLCKDSAEMGQIMARELVDEIQAHNAAGEVTRAIIPCGPGCWYRPFTDLVNRERVSLRNLVVFHMDECLDWQGRELPRKHPYSFRGFMEKHFYGPVDPALAVPEANRHWLNAQNVEEIKAKIWVAPIDITYGGWGRRAAAAASLTAAITASCTSFRIMSRRCSAPLSRCSRSARSARTTRGTGCWPRCRRPGWTCATSSVPRVSKPFSPSA